jgi:hypothetical protein
MKKSVYTNSSWLLMVILLFTACEGTFVPDPIDPRLPKYTEHGNNVAGAFIDGQVWESVVTTGFLLNPPLDAPFITVWPKQDSLIISFSGDTDGQPSSIEFHLTGLFISKFEDLTSLDGKKIKLDGFGSAGYYNEGSHSITNHDKGIGQIYFRQVRKSSPSSIILSGTFGFSVHDSTGRTIKVSSGRFDYRVNSSLNFWMETEDL